MRASQLMTVSESAVAIGRVRRSLEEFRLQRVGVLRASLPDLGTQEGVEALDARRNKAYEQMHSLLLGLWNADENGFLGPREQSQGPTSVARIIRPEEFPELELRTDGTPDPDEEGARNYGLEYGLNRRSDIAPPNIHILQGMDNLWCVYSEAGLARRKEQGFGDPRYHYGAIELSQHSLRDVLYQAADFQENVDTLERISEASGVPIRSDAA